MYSVEMAKKNGKLVLKLVHEAQFAEFALRSILY